MAYPQQNDLSMTDQGRMGNSYQDPHLPMPFSEHDMPNNMNQSGNDWSGTLGGVMSGISGLFGNRGHYKNPSNAASQYYDQIPGTMTPYFDPYIQQGLRAMPQLEGQYGQMMNNPNELFRKLSQGYQQSPGYEWRRNEAMRGVNNAAAAGGRLGSMEEQQNMADITGHLADQDFETYLSHILGLYGGGISGMQGMSDTGYKASSSLAESLAQALMMQAENSYRGQSNENENNRRKGNSLWGSLGTIGGSILGGPIGGYAGNWLGNQFDNRGNG